MATIELELDGRKRLPLGRIAGDRTRYQVTELDNGELLLTPVVSISERELAFLRNPEVRTKVLRGIDQMVAGDKGIPLDDLAADLGVDLDSDEEE